MARNLTVFLSVFILSSFSLSVPLVTAVGGSCLLPEHGELETLLTTALQELSSSQVESNLIDFNFTCLTVADTREFYSFLTASILYNTTQSSDPVRAFFDVGCRNINPDVWDVGVNQARNSIRGNGSDAALRLDCGGCANPDIIPETLGLEYDKETHCYVCNDECLESELRRCTGLSPFLCCNVYDNGHCAMQCPLNKVPDHNFDCRCVNNFTGADCKTCALDCQNGEIQSANCTVCMCPSGFMGDRCETDIDECETSPCVNGICANVLGSFQCLCHSGFTGDLCETEINACESSPCRNGAKGCTSHLGQFYCDCATDFTGLACETRIDDCASNPCLNGATCLDEDEDFTCLCPPNLEGKLCDTCNMDNCAECSLTDRGVCLQCMPNFYLDEEGTCVCGLSCQNGGTPTADCAVCNCRNGFIGSNCETDIDECLSSPCVNGRCLNLCGSFDCVCDSGFIGDLCDERDQVTSASAQTAGDGLSYGVVATIALLTLILILNVFSLIVITIVCYKQKRSKSKIDVAVETEKSWIPTNSNEEKTESGKEDTKVDMS